MNSKIEKPVALLNTKNKFAFNIIKTRIDIINKIKLSTKKARKRLIITISDTGKGIFS